MQSRKRPDIAVDKVLGGCERDIDLTNRIVDSIKKTLVSHGELLIHRSPKWPTGTPSICCALTTHHLTLWLASCEWSQQQCQPWHRLVSTCRKVAQICWPWSDYKLEFYCHFGKIKERLSALDLVHCSIRRKHTSLRILSQKERSINHLHL